jgi:hypothetical protein
MATKEEPPGKRSKLAPWTTLENWQLLRAYVRTGAWRQSRFGTVLLADDDLVRLVEEFRNGLPQSVRYDTGIREKLRRELKPAQKLHSLEQRCAQKLLDAATA